MIEFAIAAGVFMPLMLGVFQFGYSFYVYNRLAGAVRDGARYGSLRAYDSGNTTPSTDYLDAVKNTVVFGQPSGGTAPVVPGLTADKVTVEVTLDNGVPDMVTVGIANYSVDAVVKNVTFNNKPTAAFRYEGRFAP